MGIEHLNPGEHSSQSIHALQERHDFARYEYHQMCHNSMCHYGDPTDYSYKETRKVTSAHFSNPGSGKLGEYRRELMSDEKFTSSLTSKFSSQMSTSPYEYASPETSRPIGRREEERPPSRPTREPEKDRPYESSPSPISKDEAAYRRMEAEEDRAYYQQLRNNQNQEQRVIEEDRRYLRDLDTEDYNRHRRNTRESNDYSRSDINPMAYDMGSGSAFFSGQEYDRHQEYQKYGGNRNSDPSPNNSSGPMPQPMPDPSGGPHNYGPSDRNYGPSSGYGGSPNTPAPTSPFPSPMPRPDTPSNPPAPTSPRSYRIDEYSGDNRHVSHSQPSEIKPSPVYGRSTSSNITEAKAQTAREASYRSQDSVKQTASDAKVVATDLYTDFNRNFKESSIEREYHSYKSSLKSTASIMGGAAMILANVVRADIQDKALDRMVSEYNAMSTVQNDNRIMTTNHEKNVNLATYRDSIDTAHVSYKAQQYEQVTVRDDAVRAANKEISAANKAYDKEYKSLEREITQVTTAHEKRVETLNARLANIETKYQGEVAKVNSNYDNQKLNAEKTYAATVTRIQESKLTDAEKTSRIAQAQVIRDTNIAKSEVSRNTELTTINARKETATVSLRTEIQKETTATQTKLDAIKTRMDGAAQTKNALVAQAEAKVNAARSAFDTNMSTVKTQYNDNKAMLRENHTVRDAELKYHTAHMSTLKMSGSAANNLHTAVFDNQKELSFFMVSTFGTAYEKDVVKALSDDSTAKALAKEKGEVYVSPLSEQDKKAAKEVLLKHGGLTGLQTDKDVNTAIKALNAAIPKIDHEIKILTGQVTTVDKDLAAAQKEMNQVALSIKESTAASKMLKSGKNEKGEKLTTAERTTLKVKVLTKEQMDQKQTALVKLQAKVNDLQNIKIDKTQKLNGFKSAQETAINQRNFLRNNGKALIDAAKNSNKAQTKKLEKGYGQILKSLSSLEKSMFGSLHGKNAIDRANDNANKYFNQLASSVNIAARAAGVGVLASKMVLQVTARPLALTVGRSQTFLKVMEGIKVRREAFAANHKILNGIGNLAGKGVGKVASQASKIIAAPGSLITLALEPEQAIKNFAVKQGRKVVVKTATLGTKGAVRTYSAASKLVKKGGQVAGKAVGKAGSALWQATLGRTKIGRAIGSVVGTAARGVGKVTGFGTSMVKRLFTKIVRMPSNLVAAISSAFSSLLALLWGMVVNVIAVLLIGLTTILIWLVLIALLLSVLYSILGWLETLTSEYQMRILNDPSYIMNLASNYRNVELSIMEMFADKEGGNSVSGKLEVNTDPVYYAVFDTSFHWFGKLPSDAYKDINFKESGERVANTNAYTLYSTLYSELETAGRNPSIAIHWYDAIVDLFRDLADLLNMHKTEHGTFYELARANTDDFKAVVTTYDTVKLTYYAGAPEDATSGSNYEVSNAKDALAMMDAIFTMDDTMDRVEALTYLGVGQYQLSGKKRLVQSAEAKKELLKSDDVDSLFWNSHNIVYNKGTKSDDIWFHNSTATTADRYGDYGVTATCENKTTVKLKYEVKTKEHADYSGCGGRNTTTDTLSMGERNWGAYFGGYSSAYFKDLDYFALYDYGDYYQGSLNGGGRAYITQRTLANLFGGTLKDNQTIYVYQEPSKSGTYVAYASVIDYSQPCTHIHTETKYINFEYCMGHIDLDTAVYVTMAKPENPAHKTIFKCAEDMDDVLIGSVGNWLFTWSRDLDVYGISGALVNDVKPSERWSDSSLIDLTLAKLEEPITYTVESDFTQMTVTHGVTAGGGQPAPVPLVMPSTADDALLFVYLFDGDTYYVVDMKSGEQKDFPCRESVASTEESTASFAASASGRFYYKFQWT